MFLIAGNSYYKLSNDTIENKRLIGEKLHGSFSQAEVLKMQRSYNRGWICSYYTFLPPELIKNGRRVVLSLDSLTLN
ncbi:hypothetical protein GCM10023185_22710 [Hymenobacter saemangeumensis]|uniref:Uncharacterized protein n=2 Tax=Hymenobacter saemangeumensis TaxID=1084522 RepID=A0ABP8IFG9_9BACT